MLHDSIDPGQSVPEWLIERLVAGDLPEHQATAVRARLAAEARLERIQELALANRATLARYPATAVAAEIERRLAASEVAPHAPAGAKAPLWQRLKQRFVELRPGMARTGLAFVGGTVLGWYFKAELLSLLVKPFAAVWPDESIGRPALHFSSPAALFSAYLWLAVAFGLVAALPVLLRELWVFVTSGVHSRAKRLAAPFVASSFTVFLAGGWYGLQHFFPAAFRFLVEFALPNGGELDITPVVLIGDYIEFALRTLLMFGFAAEIPVFVLFLRFAGIVAHQDLVRFFRYFVALALVFTVLAARLDLVSSLLVALALFVLQAGRAIARPLGAHPRCRGRLALDWECLDSAPRSNSSTRKTWRSSPVDSPGCSGRC
jgi:sec-independent protein translocase protein TatC